MQFMEVFVRSFFDNLELGHSLELCGFTGLLRGEIEDLQMVIS
jgi:hypothetical protein